MKIDVSVEVGLQTRLEGITADRTPCSQLRPRSRNEQVAALSRTKTGPGSVVSQGNTVVSDSRLSTV